MIEVILPYPPSVNSIWNYGKGHVYSSPRYKSWAAEASAAILEQVPLRHRVKGAYKLSIDAVRPDKRRRDLGNLEKVLSDILQRNGIIEDDSKAEMICLRWVTSGEGVTVRVEKAGVE